MIYTITTRKADIGDKENFSIEGPIHIRVPGKDAESDPYIGFASKELGEAFMRIKNLPTKDYCVVPINDLLGENSKNKPVLVYENERQIMEAEKDTEGYDYESLIHQNAL